MLWPAGHGPPGTFTEIATIPGLADLWAETLGDPRICIAILDGSVNRAHPSLRAQDLGWIETLASDVATSGPGAEHGTHVASIIFGRNDGLVRGVAPGCRGLIAPIFADVVRGSPVPCSQVDLARALLRVLEAGARCHQHQRRAVFTVGHGSPHPGGCGTGVCPERRAHRGGRRQPGV